MAQETKNKGGTKQRKNGTQQQPVGNEVTTSKEVGTTTPNGTGRDATPLTGEAHVLRKTTSGSTEAGNKTRKGKTIEEGELVIEEQGSNGIEKLTPKTAAQGSKITRGVNFTQGEASSPPLSWADEVELMAEEQIGHQFGIISI